MIIDERKLIEQRELLRRQEADHLAAAHAAQGALMLIDHLIDWLKRPDADQSKDHLTTQELAEMIGGPGAVADGPQPTRRGNGSV